MGDNRKHEKLPSHLDAQQFESIFWHVKKNPGTPQAASVEEVLKLISCLRVGLSTQEKSRITTRLRNLLRAYHWTMQVQYTKDGWQPILLNADHEKLSSEDVWERGAISDLLKLIPYLGEPPRIRRCLECGDWIFAEKRSDQKFCLGKNCRQAHYEKDVEVRERKRVTMRRNRLIEKKRRQIKKTAALHERRKASR